MSLAPNGSLMHCNARLRPPVVYALNHMFLFRSLSLRITSVSNSVFYSFATLSLCSSFFLCVAMAYYIPSLSLSRIPSLCLSIFLSDSTRNNRNLTHLKTCLHSIWLYFAHKKRARLSNQQENFFGPTRMENGFFSHR